MRCTGWEVRLLDILALSVTSCSKEVGTCAGLPPERAGSGPSGPEEALTGDAGADVPSSSSSSPCWRVCTPSSRDVFRLFLECLAPTLPPPTALGVSVRARARTRLRLLRRALWLGLPPGAGEGVGDGAAMGGRVAREGTKVEMVEREVSELLEMLP